jgi:hypothetical protein
MNDDEIVKVLGESIIAASRCVGDGKPQAALDMIDIVLGALPAAGLEVVELAALPTKIMALARLGRPADAQQVLVRMENLAAIHGSTNDLLACNLMRQQIKLGSPDLTARARAATEALEAGNPAGLVDMEAIVVEALGTNQYVTAIGALTILGKVYAAAEKPDLARERLFQAKELLAAHRLLDDDRQRAVVGELDRLLATLC